MLYTLQCWHRRDHSVWGEFTFYWHCLAIVNHITKWWLYGSFVNQEEHQIRWVKRKTWAIGIYIQRLHAHIDAHLASTSIRKVLMACGRILCLRYTIMTGPKKAGEWCWRVDNEKSMYRFRFLQIHTQVCIYKASSWGNHAPMEAIKVNPPWTWNMIGPSWAHWAHHERQSSMAHGEPKHEPLIGRAYKT